MNLVDRATSTKNRQTIGTNDYQKEYLNRQNNKLTIFIIKNNHNHTPLVTMTAHPLTYLHCTQPCQV